MPSTFARLRSTTRVATSLPAGSDSSGSTPTATLAAVVGQAIEEVAEAVKRVAKNSKIAEARQWVAETLTPGPMKAVKLQKLAMKAGIAERTLRRALKALKVQHTRNRDKSWSMSLVQADPDEGQKQ
jgi:hypothetical protein